MLSTRLLIRAACRLGDAWRAAQPPASPDAGSVLEPLENSLRALRHTAERLAKAHRAGLTMAVAPLQDRWDWQFRSAQDLLTRLRRDALPARSRRTLLSDWIAELRQTEDEFGGLIVDWRRRVIAVTTEPVTLEGIDLGPFALELHWGRVTRRPGVAWFDVVAVEPNPAAARPGVTHPHVRDRRLCAGDAARPLEAALADGRLADAFVLIRGVLEHYNPDSPFVPLDEWGGVGCQDCGRVVGPGDRSYCDLCGEDYCDDCAGVCSGCDASRCYGCLDRCAVCDDACCPACLEECAATGRDCCPACLEKCAGCGASVTADQLSAGSDRCPACVSREPGEPGATAPDRTTIAIRSFPPPEDDDETSAVATQSPEAAALDVCPTGLAEAPVLLPRG